MNKYSKSVPSVKQKYIEKHQFKFRSVLIPADVFHLVIDKTITQKEFMLLLMIDNLVEPKGGEGCWASNRYLANSLEVTDIRYIKRMIQKLKHKGYVRQIGWKITPTGSKTRILETAWSRVVPFDKGGGRADHRGGGRADHPNNTNNTLKGIPSINIKKKGKQTPHKSNSKKNKICTNTEYQISAKKLKDALRKNGRRIEPFRVQEWSKDFELLSIKDGITYGSELDWYCNHCSREDQKIHKLPSVTSAKQFRKHFEWIRDCYLRDEKNSWDRSNLREFDSPSKKVIGREFDAPYIPPMDL